MSTLVRIVLNAAALWVAASVIDGIELSSTLWQVLLVAVVFGVVNSLIKPIFQLLTFPLLIVTIGLFSIVVNAVMLNVTSWLTPYLSVEGFGDSVWGGVIVGVTSWFLSIVVSDK